MNHGCRVDGEGLPIIALGAGGIATSLIKLRKEYLIISAHHEEMKLHCLQDLEIYIYLYIFVLRRNALTL